VSAWRDEDKPAEGDFRWREPSLFRALLLSLAGHGVLVAILFIFLLDRRSCEGSADCLYGGTGFARRFALAAAGRGPAGQERQEAADCARA